MKKVLFDKIMSKLQTEMDHLLELQKRIGPMSEDEREAESRGIVLRMKRLLRTIQSIEQNGG